MPNDIRVWSVQSVFYSVVRGTLKQIDQQFQQTYFHLGNYLADWCFRKLVVVAKFFPKPLRDYIILDSMLHQSVTLLGNMLGGWYMYQQGLFGWIFLVLVELGAKALDYGLQFFQKITGYNSHLFDLSFSNLVKISILGVSALLSIFYFGSITFLESSIFSVLVVCFFEFLVKEILDTEQQIAIKRWELKLDKENKQFHMSQLINFYSVEDRNNINSVVILTCFIFINDILMQRSIQMGLIEQFSGEHTSVEFPWWQWWINQRFIFFNQLTDQRLLCELNFDANNAITCLSADNPLEPLLCHADGLGRVTCTP